MAVSILPVPEIRTLLLYVLGAHCIAAVAALDAENAASKEEDH